MKEQTCLLSAWALRKQVFLLHHRYDFGEGDDPWCSRVYMTKGLSRQPKIQWSGSRSGLSKRFESELRYWPVVFSGSRFLDWKSTPWSAKPKNGKGLLQHFGAQKNEVSDALRSISDPNYAIFAFVYTKLHASCMNEAYMAVAKVAIFFFVLESIAYMPTPNAFRPHKLIAPSPHGFPRHKQAK